MSHPRRVIGFHVSAMIAFLAFPVSTAPVTAQGQEVRSARGAALIVDGLVEQVYRGDRQLLVKVLVQKSEAPNFQFAPGLSYPAPGERLYIHVPSSRPTIGRVTGRANLPGPPRPNMRIRAFLSAGREGQWEANGSDWYRDSAADREPPVVDSRPGDRTGSPIGILSQDVILDGKIALKVIEVTRGSPAAEAGIEQGDILVEADRVPLRNQVQLDRAYLDSVGKLALTVRDYRSGRDVLVDVKSASTASKPGNKPLGIKSVLAFFGGEPALAVTAVAPGSSAQRAGIRAGILILTVNGEAVSKPETLDRAAKNARGRLELQIVDPKDRRKRTVTVSL